MEVRGAPLIGATAAYGLVLAIIEKNDQLFFLISLFLTNFSSYIATGLWHHYLIFKDEQFLNEMLPSLSKAIDFVISMQTENGDIYWAAEDGKEILE